MIGFCGIKYLPELGWPDIGYRMLPAYWGKGLGMEAAKAMLDYARTHLNQNKIYGDAVVENIASNKIIQKLGFQFVEQYKHEEFTVNRYVFEVTN